MATGRVGQQEQCHARPDPRFPDPPHGDPNVHIFCIWLPVSSPILTLTKLLGFEQDILALS